MRNCEQGRLLAQGRVHPCKGVRCVPGPGSMGLRGTEALGGAEVGSAALMQGSHEQNSNAQ